MQSSIVFRFDEDDASPLDVRTAQRIEGLFDDEIPSDERAEDRRTQPHPGIKAIRAIKGNAFTADHVRQFVDYVEILCRRREGRITAVAAERDARPRDPMSLGAYDHLLEGMRLGVQEARRLSSALVAEFNLARSGTAA